MPGLWYPGGALFSNRSKSRPYCRPSQECTSQFGFGLGSGGVWYSLCQLLSFGTSTGLAGDILCVIVVVNNVKTFTSPDPWLRPAVRTPVVRTAFSAFNGPFRCASLWLGPPGCRDCSHSATKIRVDVEHPASMPETLLESAVVIFGEMSGKSPFQMRHRWLPLPAEDDPRRTRGTEASGTGKQRHGRPRLPGPREGCLQLTSSTMSTSMSRSRNSWSRHPRKLPVGA